jgi:hypothetical protein
MRHHWLALASTLLAACLANEPPMSDRAQSSTGALAEAGDGNICDLLPPDGPCSLLCDPDPDALSDQYVPPGTCASFLCDLEDGRHIDVHACHPPDRPSGAAPRLRSASDGDGG